MRNGMKEIASKNPVLLLRRGQPGRREQQHHCRCVKRHRKYEPSDVRPGVREERKGPVDLRGVRSAREYQHLIVRGARRGSVLQRDFQIEIVDSGRLVLIEDFADGVKLDEIAAQRPAHKGLALKAAQDGQGADDQACRDRHPAQGASFAAARHRSEPVHCYAVNRR
jgi:hypothetical protein